jgi:hypothetical protein
MERYRYTKLLGDARCCNVIKSHMQEGLVQELTPKKRPLNLWYSQQCDAV